MSLSQRSLGCSDVKPRWMRFGDALFLRESVVTSFAFQAFDCESNPS
jgi:hypothetical protein